MKQTKKQIEIKKIIIEKLNNTENKEINIKLRYAKDEFGFSPLALKHSLDQLKKDKIIKIEKIGSKGGLKIKLHIKQEFIEINSANNNFINSNFLGREKDLINLKQELSKKNHLLIFGKTGIGKTTLIKNFFNNQNIIYINYLNSVKEIYKLIISQIIDIGCIDENEKKEIEKELKKQNIKIFQDFLKDKIKNHKNLIIVIDNINNNINKNFLGIIQTLKQSTQIILIMRVEILNNLTNNEVVWGFKKIEIMRLDKFCIKLLVENLIQNNNLTIINRSIFFKKIESITKGNLIALIDILKQLKNEGIIDFEKINNISHDAETRYFDLTYLILLLIIFAVVLRILGRSNQNNDYMLVGSVLLYVFMFIRLFLFKMIK